MADPITLRDGDDALATVHPELGGWLVRYAKRLPGRGLVTRSIAPTKSLRATRTACGPPTRRCSHM